MPLLFERGLAGEGTGETVSLDLKLEKWEGLGGGGSRRRGRAQGHSDHRLLVSFMAQLNHGPKSD
jgi:hypothetical protein